MPREWPTSQTAATSASFITVCFARAAGTNSSPDGLIFSVSTPSRTKWRAATPEFVGAVADHAERFAVQMGEPHVAEPARHRHLRRRRQHARAGNVAGVDRVADDDVEPWLGRGGAADAGEALIEEDLDVLDRQQQVLLGRNFAQRLEARRVGEARMGVRFDQARHQRRAAAVDLLGAGGADRLARLRDRLDAVAVDQHLAAERRAAATVDHRHVPEQRLCHRICPPFLSPAGCAASGV